MSLNNYRLPILQMLLILSHHSHQVLLERKDVEDIVEEEGVVEAEIPLVLPVKDPSIRCVKNMAILGLLPQMIITLTKITTRGTVAPQILMVHTGQLLKL